MGYSNIICYFIILIPVLINVAFITLLERKILGYRQLRKGPNKVRFIGIAQPFRDAIKLFSNEIILPFLSNKKQFFFAPLVALLIVIITFSFYPLIENNLNLRFGVLFYIIIRINVYPLIIRGWSSNRKYALIGRIRGIAQTISYEVIFALVLLFFLILSKRINILTLVLLNTF